MRRRPFLHQTTLHVFRFAYCSGVVVDRLRPTHGAHRLVSITLASGLMSGYFLLVRGVYDLFGVKVPEVVLYGVLGGLVAWAWRGLKSWQFAHLRAAQAAVPRSHRRSQITCRGWAAALLATFSILVVLLVAVATLESYTYWP